MLSFFLGIKLAKGNFFEQVLEDWAEKYPSENERFARVMQYGHHINDIYSCSWGAISLFANNIGYTSELIDAAMKNATEKVSSLILQDDIL